MEFTSPVARRTRLQKAKLATASSSRASKKKKGGTISSETKVTKASSSAAKKSRKPAGVVRTGNRGHRPRVGRNRLEDSDCEVISLEDTDSDDDDGLDMGFGSGGSSDVPTGVVRDREMLDRRSGESYSVISLGSGSSDDEEEGPLAEGEERLLETGSGWCETSPESEAEDSDDEGEEEEEEVEEKEEEDEGTESHHELFQWCEMAGEERKRGRLEARLKESTGDEGTDSHGEIVWQSDKAGKMGKRGRPGAQLKESTYDKGTESLDEIVCEGEKAGKERKQGKPRAQQEETTGYKGRANHDEIACQCEMACKKWKRGRPRARQKVTTGSSCKCGLRSNGSHLSREVELDDVEVISLGSSDDDDTDDFPDVFAGVQMPGPVASRTRSNVSPTMSMRGAIGTGRAASSSSDWKLREKKIAYDPLRNEALKMKLGGGKRTSERYSGASTYSMKKNGVERDSDILSSSKGHPEKKVHSTKKKGVEGDSDVLSSSMGPPKKEKTASDIQKSKNLGGKPVEKSKYKEEMESMSNMMNLDFEAAKKNGLERDSDILSSSKRPPEKQVHSTKMKRVERDSEILSSSMAPKKGKTASDIHETENSGGKPVEKSEYKEEMESMSNMMNLDLEAAEKNGVERDSDILCRGMGPPKEEKTASDIHESENSGGKPVEKSQCDEMDDIWNVMNLGLQDDRIDSYSSRNKNIDADYTELNTSQAALCRQGKHDLFLDEQIGQRCRH
ncbi:hypothetical protein CDL15_Pgr006055 [Punica granatum]|uniref:Uncharacterized protein n=1 Tax=Punica granatum TaxID=22663 RepID=A0A218VTX3_PUNGR|nr:hypothetical protein CDL15_Pgr006055 [Punica granatum]